VQQPPVVLGFQGFTAALLEAAGYSDVAVVAEWRGGSRAPGGAPERSRQFNSLVAWVKAPLADPELRDLPGSFQDPTTGGTCRVQVRTRLPNGLKQFNARQAMLAAAASASPPPAPVPDGGEDMQVDGAGAAQQTQPASQQPQTQQQTGPTRRSKRGQKHQPSAAEVQQPQPSTQEASMAVDPPQSPAQQQGAGSGQQMQRAARSSKRVQQQQPSDAEVQQWMAASEVWCSLAEQAQHLLESQDRPWTQREQRALAAAYMVAFERSSAQVPSTEREWLMDHYGLTPDQEDYADGVAAGGQRRYPVRPNRGLPADPWYAAATPQAPSQTPTPTLTPTPTRPTGAQGRQGRTR